MVSENWRKDDHLSPQKYAALGCPELVIFDPDAARGSVTPSRVPLQVWRRNHGRERSFEQVHAGPGPYHVKRLDAWLVPVREDGCMCLRLAYDPQCQHWVPTSQEAQAREAQARKQAETARFAAEARVRELEVLLARQQAGDES